MMTVDVSDERMVPMRGKLLCFMTCKLPMFFFIFVVFYCGWLAIEALHQTVSREGYGKGWILYAPNLRLSLCNYSLVSGRGIFSWLASHDIAGKANVSADRWNYGF
jgi:hypothetical protein